MLEPDQGSPRMRSLVWMPWPAYGAEQANANASITVCSVLCWQLLSHQWSSTNVDLTRSQQPKNSNPRKTETQVLCLTLCLFAPAPWDTASLCLPSSTCEVEMVIESYLVGKAHWKAVALTSSSLAEARKLLLSSGFRVTTTIAATHRFINKPSPAVEPIPARLSGSAQVF